MNVLITKAYHRISLCVIQALSKIGCRIYVGDYMPYSMSFYSRKVNNHILYANPFENPDKFLFQIIDFIKTNCIDVIIPVEDDTFFIAKYADILREYVRIPLAPYETLIKVQKKDTLSELAEKLEILHPKTIPMKNVKDYEEVKNKIKELVLIKPIIGGGGEGIIKLDNTKSYSSQITEYFKSNLFKPEDLIFQEYIPTKEKYSNVVIYQNGKCI